MNNYMIFVAAVWLSDWLTGGVFVPSVFELTGPSASSGSTYTSCAATPSKQQPLGIDEKKKQKNNSLAQLHYLAFDSPFSFSFSFLFYIYLGPFYNSS